MIACSTEENLLWMPSLNVKPTCSKTQQCFNEQLQRFIIYPLSYAVLQRFIEALNNLTRSLFGLKLNSLFKAISLLSSALSTLISLYVTGQNINVIKHHLQQCLCKLYCWADNNGFTFFIPKQSAFISVDYRNCALNLSFFLNDSMLPLEFAVKLINICTNIHCVHEKSNPLDNVRQKCQI